ncbi:MAG: hypothetical protein A2512_05255 [Deltaproteobacteria bacterium RIFOXYD12_FULL_56_24]|nr:MAG: hypothetical protein A2512_05255 [Deltaproteobacteria bacterium RIFOXYD12_FULL_56_24]
MLSEKYARDGGEKKTPRFTRASGLLRHRKKAMEPDMLRYLDFFTNQISRKWVLPIFPVQLYKAALGFSGESFTKVFVL